MILLAAGFLYGFYTDFEALYLLVPPRMFLMGGREAKQLFPFILSLDSDLDISVTRIKCKKRWTSGEEMGLEHNIRIAFSSILYSLQELNRLTVKGFSILFSSSVIIQFLLCHLFRKVCKIKSIFGIIIY